MRLFLFLVLQFLIFTAVPSSAQLADITITEVSGLNFGRVIINPAGDNIVLTPSGSVSSSNGGSVLSGFSRAASYNVTGEPNTAVLISASSNATLNGPGAAIRLENFTNNAGTTPAFNGAGLLVFSLGATLQVGSGQASGTYAGTYVISVDY